MTQWNTRLETEGIGATLVLRAEVKRLADQLGKAVSKNRLSPPDAPYWLGLTRDGYAGQPGELRSWVESFLRVHYPGYATRLRPCWPNHPEAIWELSDLMQEWIRVYGDDENRDLAGALW